MEQKKKTPRKKKFKFSAKTKEKMRGVNPILIKLAELALNKSEYDFGVIENGGFRTAEMQNELFRKGVANCDGYNFISIHQTGNAIKLVPFINRQYTWDNTKAFEGINKAIVEAWEEMKVKGVKLEWGGNRKTAKRDYSHYQIRAKR